MAMIYTRFSGWIKYSGVSLALAAATGFFGIFLGILTMKHAMMAGPLTALLYILNAWVGVRYLAFGDSKKAEEPAAEYQASAP